MRRQKVILSLLCVFEPTETMTRLQKVFFITRRRVADVRYQT